MSYDFLAGRLRQLKMQQRDLARALAMSETSLSHIAVSPLLSSVCLPRYYGPLQHTHPSYSDFITSSKC